MSIDIKRYADYINNVSGNVLLGCDGFIDEVYRIVDVRKSLADFTSMDDMKDFGELIVRRSGGGVGLEISPKRRCSGGFTPNTGRVAAFLGLQPTLVGLYGLKEIDPAFDEFKENCNLVSLGDSAVTLVFEFLNGKVLLSDLKAVANFTWENFVEFFTEMELGEMFAGRDIVGLGYWSLTPDFDNFLKGIVSRYENTPPPSGCFSILQT